MLSVNIILLYYPNRKMHYQKIKAKYEKEYDKLLNWKNDKMRLYRLKKIVNEITKQFWNNKDLELLDYWAGDGFLSMLLPNQVSYNYLDITDNQHKTIRKENTNQFCFETDFSLPFFWKTFDIIVLSEVIEHLPDVYKTLSDLKNILKKDGIIIITTPNAFYRVNILKWILGKYIDPSEQHVNLYDYSTLINIFKFGGYDLVKSTEYFFFSYWLFNFCPILDKRLSKIFKYISLNLFQVYKKNEE